MSTVTNTIKFLTKGKIMKHILPVFTLGMLMSFTAPVFALNTPEEKAKLILKQQEEQKEKDEVKSNLAAGLIGATVIAAAGGALSQIPAIQGTGLDVGIGASTILGSLSVLFDGKKAEGFRSMAITAPIIALMGAALNSEKVMGSVAANGVVTKGYLAQYGMYGINALAESALKDPSKRVAFLSLAVVGTYIAIRPSLDKFSGWIARKGSEAYNYAADALS